MRLFTAFLSTEEGLPAYNADAAFEPGGRMSANDLMALNANFARWTETR
jgi:hypothetical protein